jgi:hypothetical protein
MGYLAWHLRIEVKRLTTDRKRGQTRREISPQFAPYVLSDPPAIEAVDAPERRLDFVFCAPQRQRPIG